MKIISISGKNINSLHGSWTVNLDDPAYRSEGIFAISGPTGAGKSSILDALSLALYGRTPRLDKLNAGSNEVMSRHTAECQAEVVFSCASGQYRASWSQRRARNSAQGKLQNQQHEMHDLSSGTVESGVSRVPDLIAEVCGLDYTQFCRSILLAQGDFAAFLKADRNDRSLLLEQITGTELYSQLSQAAHMQEKLAKQAVSDTERDMANAAPLSAPERFSLEAKQQELTAEQLIQKEELAKTAAALAWRTGLKRLEQEADTLQAELNAARLEAEAARPEQEQLARAQQAANLESDYTRASLLSKEQAEDQEKLEQAQGARSGLAAEQQAAAATAERAQQELITARHKQLADAELLKKVRSLDVQLQSTGQDLEENSASLAAVMRLLETARAEALATDNNIAAEAATLNETGRWLFAHAAADKLAGELPRLREVQHNLLDLQAGLVKIQTQEAKLLTSISEAEKKASGLSDEQALRQSELENIQKLIEEKTGVLKQILDGRDLAWYQNEKETLYRELGLIRRMLSYEEERRNLMPGQPCPLCGALEHPYVQAGLAVENETAARIKANDSIMAKAADIQEQIQKAGQEAQQADKSVYQLTLQQQTEQDRKNLLLSQLEQCRQELTAQSEKIQTAEAGLRTALLQLAPPAAAQENSSTLQGPLEAELARLQELANEWNTQTEQQRKAELQLQLLRQQQQGLTATLKHQEAQSKTLQKKVQEKTLARIVLQEQRSSLFGEQDPDAFEKEQLAASATLEEWAKQAAEAVTTIRSRLDALEEAINNLTERITKRTPGLQAATSKFTSALQQAGFVDEAVFMASRLPLAAMRELEQKQAELGARSSRLEALLKDRLSRIAAEKDSGLSPLSSDELATIQQQQEEKIGRHNEELALLRTRLQQDQELRLKVKGLSTRLEALRKEHAEWAKLDALIGSADGKKYREFAQNLTLRQLLQLANRKLSLLSDRYQLTASQDSNLEFDIIDNYQAGEIRSTRNLSGGESFLVSLALALALAGMSGNRARVDSLFLDEGFGSLDEESLDSALGTLGTLSQEGKLVGLISHVPLIRERIATHIQVQPLNGGRSRLSGPGVSHEL